MSEVRTANGITNTYSRKDGSKYPVCKDCLTAHTDNRDPNIFYGFKKNLDVPYIETIWEFIFNKQYMKNPAKFNGLYLDYTCGPCAYLTHEVYIR